VGTIGFECIFFGVDCVSWEPGEISQIIRRIFFYDNKQVDTVQSKSERVMSKGRSI